MCIKRIQKNISEKTNESYLMHEKSKVEKGRILKELTPLIIQMHTELDLSTTQIGEYFGVGHGTITKLLKKHNVLKLVIKHNRLNDIDVPDGMKVCYTCERVLYKKFFSKDNEKKDGLSYQCKECRANRRLKEKLDKIIK